MNIKKTAIFTKDLKNRKPVIHFVYLYNENGVYYFAAVKKFMGVYVVIHNAVIASRMPDKFFDNITTCFDTTELVMSFKHLGDVNDVKTIVNKYRKKLGEYVDHKFEYKYGDKIVMMEHPLEDIGGICFTSSGSPMFECVYSIEKYWESDKDEEIYTNYKYTLVPVNDIKYNIYQFGNEKMYVSKFKQDCRNGDIRKVID